MQTQNRAKPRSQNRPIATYQQIEMPIHEHWHSVKVEVESLDPSVIEQKEIHAVALGESLAAIPTNSRGIPKYPNPRGLNTTQKVYQQMLETLLLTPHLFKERNHGLKLSAYVKDITPTSYGTSILTLSFAPPSGETIGQGLHDGQHTLHSFAVAKLNGAKIDKARARLLILNGYEPNQEEGQNTIAWQQSYRHDNKTKYNAQGKFEPIKQWIPPTWRVAYYQNQPDVPNSPRCSIDHIIQLLGVLDSTKYNWLNAKQNRHPIIYARNLGNNYEQVCASACNLAHLVEDVVELEQSILEWIIKDYKKTRQKVPGFSFPEAGKESEFKDIIVLPNRQVLQMSANKGFIFPMISAFRLLLEPVDRWKTLDWSVDFKQHKSHLIKALWNRTKTSLLEKAELGVGQNASGILLVDLEYWHTLCAEAHKFVHTRVKRSA